MLREHWKFGDNTFSRNHPMFGSAHQWLYNWLGGIEVDVDGVGFGEFTFQPQFLDNLDQVHCTHRSIRGPITCGWKRQGDRAAIDLNVPINTSAMLILPAAGAITENGRPISGSLGVKKTAESNRRVEFTLGSGRYQFMQRLRLYLKMGHLFTLPRLTLRNTLPSIESQALNGGFD